MRQNAAVLAVPEIPAGEQRRGLLLRYGDMVASLSGTYRTAADMNTSAADMDVIAERCPYVYGRSQEQGGAGDSGWGTDVYAPCAVGGTLSSRSIPGLRCRIVAGSANNSAGTTRN